MKSIDFPNSNQVIPTKTGNMPVFIGASGEIISRWEFTWKELWQIILKRSIFISQYPNSIAFPQGEIEFRPLTEEEEKHIAEMEKNREKEMKKQRVKMNGQNRRMKVRR